MNDQSCNHWLPNRRNLQGSGVVQIDDYIVVVRPLFSAWLDHQE